MDIPVGRRNRLALSCLDQVIEHHRSVCTLVEQQLYGSAFTLVRPIFEGYVRGVWLTYCASEQEVDLYYLDEDLPRFKTLIEKIETVPGFESGVLDGLRTNSWSAMCSYAHSGAMQASRRYTQNTVEPNYKTEEIIEVLKISASFALMSFQQIASTCNRLDLAKIALDLHSPKIQ